MARARQHLRAGGSYDTAVILAPDGRIAAEITARPSLGSRRETSLAGGEFVVVDIPNADALDSRFATTGSSRRRSVSSDGLGPRSWSNRPLRPRVIGPLNSLPREPMRSSIRSTSSTSTRLLQAMGRSLIVDPEDWFSHEAGTDEELLTDVLDLDAVTRIQEHGAGCLPDVGPDQSWGGGAHELSAYRGRGAPAQAGPPS